MDDIIFGGVRDPCKKGVGAKKRSLQCEVVFSVVARDVGWNSNLPERADLYDGDLATARQIAIKAPWQTGAKYEHMPLPTVHPYENYDNEFLFPEGEALRFFYISGDETVTLFEYKNDFLVATWQAHLDPNAIDPIRQLLSGRIKDPTGPIPDIGGPFYYYETGFQGPTSWEGSGRVGTDGKLEKTDTKENDAAGVTTVTGEIAYSLPDEACKEAAQKPRP